MPASTNEMWATTNEDQIEALRTCPICLAMKSSVEAVNQHVIHEHHDGHDVMGIIAGHGCAHCGVTPESAPSRDVSK